MVRTAFKTFISATGEVAGRLREHQGERVWDYCCFVQPACTSSTKSSLGGCRCFWSTQTRYGSLPSLTTAKCWPRHPRTALPSSGMSGLGSDAWTSAASCWVIKRWPSTVILDLLCSLPQLGNGPQQSNCSYQPWQIMGVSPSAQSWLLMDCGLPAPAFLVASRLVFQST